MSDQEDVERFSKFINDFDENEYEKYIEGNEATWKDGNTVKEPTGKQIDLALTVRTPASEEEEEEIDREQAYTGEQSNIREIDNIVYDNRDLPPKSNVTIEIPRDNSPIRVLPLREGIRQNITTAQLPRTFTVVNNPQNTPQPIQKKPNIFRRFISRINIFRRKR